MNKLKSQKGLTFVELLATIVILGILIAIAVPRISSLTERSRLGADQASVGMLNSATSFARLNLDSSDPFRDDSKSSEELMLYLVEENYLESMAEPQSKDAEFVWLLDRDRWYLMFEDSFHSVNLMDGVRMDHRGNGELVGRYSGASRDIIIPVRLNGETISIIWQDTFNETGLIAVHFPSNSQVTEIGRRAFRGNQLTEITLPAQLTTIGEHAFRENSGLNKVTIGENVNIGTAAFGFNRDDNSFREVYESHGRAAGTYIFIDGSWVKE